MIGDWRKLFGQGDFPFYIVSLPAFMPRRDQPGDDAWAELREAQALTAWDVKNSGLAVTVDTGDPDNIHPKDKKVVGERLALCALAREYGKKISDAGPTFTSVEHLPGALKLHFSHTEGGLVVKGDKLEEFAVAGRRPPMALGRCQSGRGFSGRVISNGFGSSGRPLCLASQSGGDSLQWSRIAGGPIPHGQLVGDY